MIVTKMLTVIVMARTAIAADIHIDVGTGRRCKPIYYVQLSATHLCIH